MSTRVIVILSVVFGLAVGAYLMLTRPAPCVWEDPSGVGATCEPEVGQIPTMTDEGVVWSDPPPK